MTSERGSNCIAFENLANKFILPMLSIFSGSGEDKELAVEIALFGEEAPMSVMNFLGLCRGYNKKGVRS